MKNNYPFIFVHGTLGYGDNDFVSKLANYWGLSTGNLIKNLNQKGLESYAPSLGGLTGLWDRCCDLYARLVGGTVDYGKAHSEKYGHPRFGKTYKEPLIKNFDEKHKINLIGSSFGGPNVILFSSLMAYGSKEEREVTDENDLSPLFKGGHGKYINSVITLAGVNNGTTLFEIGRPALKPLNFLMCSVSNLFGKFPFLSEFHDLGMEQFGLQKRDENGKFVSTPFDFGKIKNACNSKEGTFYEMGLTELQELNEKFKTNNDAYYFAFPYRTTKTNKNQKENPLLSTLFIHIPFAFLMGRYENSSLGVDEKWFQNDCLVNTISEKAPFNSKSEEFVKQRGNFERGTWYNMPVQIGDHFAHVGGMYPKLKNDYQTRALNFLTFVNNLH